MANELKTCPFCSKPMVIRGGVNPYGRCNTDGCWMMEVKLSVVCDDPKQAERWNTRPAAPVEGLERYKYNPYSNHGSAASLMEINPLGEYVRFDQAEAIISAKDAEYEQRLKGWRDAFDSMHCRAMDAEADNAALTGRVKKLEADVAKREEHRGKLMKGYRGLETQLSVANKRADELEAAWLKAEALLSEAALEAKP